MKSENQVKFAAFEPVKVELSSAQNLIGGSCTGGGFELLGVSDDGVATYHEWTADESNCGNITYSESVYKQVQWIRA